MPTPAADPATTIRLAEVTRAHKRGWSLIPLNGKRPIHDSWTTMPPLPLDTLLAAARTHNIGIRTGKNSGVIIVDIDSPDKLKVAISTQDEATRTRISSIKTPTLITGSGWKHFYFNYRPDIKTSHSVPAACVDILSDGAQGVYAGSVHPTSGRRYEWAPGASPDDLPLADFPDWLAAVLTPKPTPVAPPQPSVPADTTTPYAMSALKAEVARVRAATKPLRNDTLNKAAFSLGQLIAGGQIPESVVTASLVPAAEACGLPDPSDGDPADYHVRTIRSGIEAGMKVPRYPKPKPPAKVIPHPSSPSPSTESKPTVLLPGAHVDNSGEFHEIGCNDFTNTTLSALPGGALYRRAGVVGEISEGRFRSVSGHRARSVINEHIRFVRWRSRATGSPEEVFVSCQKDDAELIIATAAVHPLIRELDILTTYPVFTPGLTEPGWNEASNAYYHSTSEIAPVRSVPAIQAALADLVVDFPFASRADRENFFGLLLTPLIRPAVMGNVPLHMIHSPLERTGKTKLAEEVLGGVILGRPTPALQLTGSDDERDKRILAVLLRGDTIIHFDNIHHGYLDSPALASLVTASNYSGRVLGQTELCAPRNLTTIVATGNNIRMTGELAKRTVPIVLRPPTDRPEERTDFAHPDLRAYVTAERGRIMGCLVGMVLNWQAEGSPMVGPPFGGFERWTRMIAGILAANGFAEHLSNRDSWVSRTNTDGDDLEQFVALWAERYGSAPASPKQLCELASDGDMFDRLFRKGTSGAPDKATIATFARHVLAASEDRPVRGWVIRRGRTESIRYWYLEQQQPETSPPPPAAY